MISRRHVAAILLSLSSTLLAAPGDLVTSFGTGGKVLTNFKTGDTGANAMALSGTKAVVVGHGHNGTDTDFAIVRINADGSVDQSFGFQGRATVDFGGSEQAEGVAIQADNKIVVAGRTTTGSWDFLLARLNSNGGTDDTFGTDGKVRLPFSGGDQAFALALQADGKIVVGGNAYPSSFLVARYNTNGSLDTSFGCPTPGSCSGFKVTSLGATGETIYGLVVQGDGKIVAAGGTGVGGDFALVRYLPNGTLDPDFGCGTPGTCSGVVTTPILSDEDQANALLLQPDGMLVAGGYARSGGGSNSLFALARYLPNGTLDATFGLGGKVTTEMDTGFDFINSLALQSDGRIVAAGHSTGSSTRFALARYEWNGFLDANFGCPTPGSCSGTVIVTMGSTQDSAHAVAVQADGKVIAAGSHQLQAFLFDMAFLGLNPDGTVNASFGSAGKAFAAFGATGDYANAVIHHGSRIVSAGSMSTPTGVTDFAIAGYTTSGVLDTTFGTGGRTIVDFGGGEDIANAIVVNPADGKFLVVGSGFNVSTTDFAIARLLANGQLDTSFGVGGRVFASIGTESDDAHAAVLQADGKLVVGGITYSFPETHFALARFNSNGALDATFGTGGKVTTSFAVGNSDIRSLALQGDGKIVAAGFAGPVGPGQEMALARYNANGTLDTDFGCATPGTCSGKVNFSAGSIFASLESVKVLGDGKIVAAGYYYAASTADFVAVRLNSNGTLDTGFGSGGVVTIPVGETNDLLHDMKVDAVGRLVLVGSAYNGANDDAVVVRLLGNGALDASFGSGGKSVVPVGSAYSVATAMAFIPASMTIVIAGYAVEGNYSGSDDFMLAAVEGGGAAPPTSARRMDINGDAKGDVLFRHGDGTNYVWHINGAVITGGVLEIVSQGLLPSVDGSWSVAGMGDFNGDGKADILWRNTSGTNYVWHLDGATISGSMLTIVSQGLLPGVDTSWSVAGIADFNGDGKSDILWRKSDGTNYVWHVNGAVITGSMLEIVSQGLLPGVPVEWTVVGLGDYNGDAKGDIFWRHDDGTNYVWHVDGSVITGGLLSIPSQGLLPGVDNTWTVVATGDYNGDAKSDVFWRQIGTGTNYVWHVNGAVITGGVLEITSQGLLPGVDATWAVVGQGDYNGDGKTDVFWRKVDGTNYVWHVDGAVITGGLLSIPSQGLLPGVDASWTVINTK